MKRGKYKVIKDGVVMDTHITHTQALKARGKYKRHWPDYGYISIMPMSDNKTSLLHRVRIWWNTPRYKCELTDKKGRSTTMGQHSWWQAQLRRRRLIKCMPNTLVRVVRAD